MTESPVERPENVPSGYFWLVGGCAFVLASIAALTAFWPAALLTAAGAWFCFRVGTLRARRYRAARAAAAPKRV
jgi:hypothetical protein